MCSPSDTCKAGDIWQPAFYSFFLKRTPTPQTFCLSGFRFSAILLGFMEDSADSYAADLRETSTPACRQATEKSKPMEWTDEKHSLYLKSMETTFVNHLYKLLAQQSHKNLPLGPKLSRQAIGVSTPSGQYKVLRFGCWSKIDFVREEPELNQMEESGAPVLSANPWIRHYRCPGRRANRRVSSKVTSSANKSPMHDPLQFCSPGSDDGDTEVTDQNFNDDNGNLEEEKSSRLQIAKRARTLTGTDSTTDQVVPYEDTVQDNNADDHAQDD